jgi:hypothetical protein
MISVAVTKRFFNDLPNCIIIVAFSISITAGIVASHFLSYNYFSSAYNLQFVSSLAMK